MAFSDAQKIVESLSIDLLGSPFDANRQAAMVLSDAGVDAGDVTVSEIVQAFQGSLKGDRWRNVAFTSDEVLAQYCSIELSNEEFVRAIFVALIVAESNRRGLRRATLPFDKTCILVARNLDKGDEEFRIDLFAELVSRRRTRSGG